MFSQCPTPRSLGAYADDELSGDERLRISRHVQDCARCAHDIAGTVEIGELLRAQASTTAAIRERQVDLDSLASSVITRTRVEFAESWRALLDRAVGNWQWAIVGTGSVVATLLSTAFVSVILAFGPKPERDDSLSALMNNLVTPPGVLFVYATPVGSRSDSLLLQVENGQPTASSATAAMATGAGYQRPTDADLVYALADVVTRRGRVVALEAMHPVDRRYAEELLDEIGRRRFAEPIPVGATINVHELRLVTSTSVSAKGL